MLGNKIKKRRIATAIILAMFISGFLPIKSTYSIDNLGTNQALGSPLLNQAFKNESWDKWETIAFGVFLSNFAYPFIDDYASTFSNLPLGSRGSGFKALDFGTGRDPENNEMLKKLLEYEIAIQRDPNNLKEIYVKKETYNRTSDRRLLSKSGETEYEEATIEDFFPEAAGKFDIVTSYELSTLAIKTGQAEDESSMTVVFSFADGWDTQMLAALMSRVSLGEYSKEAGKALDKMISDDAKLYLDVFGNIVAMNGDRHCIIFPAACNQYITRDNRYNLVTSLIFGGNYLTANDYSIIDKLEATRSKFLWWNTKYYEGGGASGVASEESRKYLKPGSVVLTYDTVVPVTQKEIDNNPNNDNQGDYVADDESFVDPMLRVLQADINKKHTTMGFLVDVVGLNSLDVAHERFKNLNDGLVMLGCVFPVSNNREKLTYVRDNTGEKVEIFGSPVTTSVNIKIADSKHNNFSELVCRRYISFIQQYISSGSKIASNTYANSVDSQSTLLSNMRKAKNRKDLAKVLMEREGKVNPLLAAFIESYGCAKDGSAIFKKSEKPKKSLIDCGVGDIKSAGYVRNKDGKNANINIGTMESALSRVVKVYPYNSDIAKTSNILGVRQGTNFGLWSPYIYMTYLEFYGVTGGRSHNFNTNIFDAESDVLKMDIAKVTAGATISEEEKKERILDYSLMLLDPEKGREYRSNMMMSSFTDWIYRTYQNIVYGKAIEYNASDSTKLLSRQTPGFLHVDNLSENFMTGWFIQRYAKYLLILIGVGLIAIIIVGIMQRKKVIWVLLMGVSVVTVAIITPAIGEIIPYVSNNVVQGMFKDKMSYWAISESVTNSQLEAAEASTAESAENAKISKYVKMLNIAYLDRSLVIKNDISKKITSTQLANLEELQRLQSARWMLPILIRQFSASDGSADYIYVPLADVYDNLSNLYWYYNPSDATNVKTIAADDMLSKFKEEAANNKIDLTTKTMIYKDYINTSNDAAMSKGWYNNLAIISDDTDYSSKPGWESLSRLKDDSQVVHGGSYIIRGLEVPSTDNNVDDWDKFNYKDVWKKYAEDNKENTTVKTSLEAICIDIENQAGGYSSREPSATMNEYFGFLWFTESPFHYFYQVVKDTFEPGITVGTAAAEIQGVYEDNRETLMHYKDTGKVRDFLDMQELFTNVIPYMYKVQLLAGGYDGKSGVLEDTKIEHYTLYNFMNKSWLFRSNWVTKLSNSDNLNKKAMVSDRDGNKYKVANPMDPSTYPTERPMVFSEAQMYAQGLTELNLSIPELKIIKVNDNVMRKWTLCLNYVNISGMTTEVLYRHMALLAVTEFNKEFSPYNKINSKKSLYPYGVDLRSISFDSIMKMLMLNCTRDSSYIYGDTMKRVIENTDTFSAVLMLLMAFLCTFVIPLVRNILIGTIFFLGLWALLSSILFGAMSKIKITTAYIINNILFLVMTILYYIVFAVIINGTYKDDVLSIDNIGVSMGTPTWIFIIIILISCVYIYYACKMIWFVIKNRKDMGFEAYAVWGSMLADKISNGIGRVTGRGGGVGLSNSINNTSVREVNIDGADVTINKNNMDIDYTNEYYSEYDYENVEDDINEAREDNRRVEIEDKIRRGSNV